MSQFERLVEIMARLRGPGGCPWDQEQTHQSLKPYLIEEAYELLDAIDAEDDVDIREELGDVLLQVVFHSQLASENKQFTIEEVAETICSKLVRRHPHVFGDVSVAGTADVLKNWEAIKSREKEERGQDASVLSGVPRHLPGLLRALRMQEKAAKVGFDWKHTEEVAGKVREEVEEFLEAHSENDAKKMEEELGDLLFSLVNLARFLHICPEEALSKTIQKFQTRFSYIETELKTKAKTPHTATLEEMDQLWEQAKKAREEIQ